MSSTAGHVGMETLPSIIQHLSANRDRTACLGFGETSVTYVSAGELIDGAARLADRLRSAGVAPKEPVLILADPTPRWVEACLAIVGVGGIIVPVDAQHTDETIEHILADSGARFIFTQGANLAQLERLGIDADISVHLLDGGQASERPPLLANDFMPVSGSPEEIAVIFYTSGTTGPPKGVPISHSNLVFEINMVEQTGLIRDSDRMLLPLPLHHVYPFVVGVFTPLALGVPIIFPRAVTGPEIIRALHEGEATIVLGVPRLYRVLFSGIQERFRSLGSVAGRLFGGAITLSRGIRKTTGIYGGKWLFRPLHRQMGPKLRIVASGGAALDAELAANLEALGWQVAIGYGLTETTSIATLHPPGEPGLTSVGRAAPGVEIRIDPAGWPSDRAKEGHVEKGEVLIKGPNVFGGYHNLPEANQDSFTEDGWFRTGDLGYVDAAGCLHLNGRASTLIVTESGENIQPRQIEDVYTGHPFIAEAAILERDGKLVGIMVPDVEEITRADLQIESAMRQAATEMSKQLPTVQSLSEVVIGREPLPRTRLGKIRRHLLAGYYDRARESKRGGQKQAKPISLEEMGAEDRSLLEVPEARKVWEYLGRRFSDHPLTLDTSPRLDLGVDSLGWLDLTLDISAKVGIELDEQAIGRIHTLRDLLQESVAAVGKESSQTVAELLTRPEAHLSPFQKQWLSPDAVGMGREAHSLYIANRFLMRRLFRLKAVGMDHLPSGPFVLTPNHASYLDAPAIAAALDFRILGDTFWGGWTGAAFANPVMRHISRLFQVVPIDPERGFFSSLAFGAAVLKKEKNLVWFPEGGRSHTGRLQAFKPGIGRLLNHYPVPIVPVVIQGSYEAMPRGSFLQSFHPIRVTFGRPLDVGRLASEGKGDPPHESIVDALRAHVRQMLDAGEAT